MVVSRYLMRMGFAALWLFFLTFRFADMTIGERYYEYPLETAWKATGISLNAVTTESWTNLNDQWLGVDELKTRAREAIGKLRLKLLREPASGNETGYCYVNFQGKSRDSTIFTITLQSVRTEKAAETQMGISTIRRGPVDKMRRYYEEIKKMIGSLQFDRFQEKPHISVIITGEYGGRMDLLLFKELTGRAFKKIQAGSVLSDYKDGRGLARGYTRLIMEKTESNGTPVNVEFEAVYDESRRLTEVSLATPSLTGF